MIEEISIGHLTTSLENYSWLEPILTIKLYNNTFAHYLIVVLLVIVVFIISKIVTIVIEKHARKIVDRTESKLDNVVIEVIHRSITFILVLTTIYFGIKSLDVPEVVDTFTVRLVFILFTLKIASELVKFVTFLIESYLLPLARKQKGLTKTFLPPLTRVVKIVIWGLAVLLIVSNLGYDVSSLIAGLGIGGLGLALAAEETLSNVFGSFMILADQPFKVGDWVVMAEYEGAIEEIGMRSTKLRTVSNTLVSIPNQTVASTVIENYSRRNEMNVSQDLSFVYGLSVKEVKDLVKALEGVLKKDPKVAKGSSRVNFLEFGDSALKLRVFYYVQDSKTFAEFLNVRERVNLNIKATANKLGAEMAFPTTSLRIENAHNIFKATEHRKTN